MKIHKSIDKFIYILIIANIAAMIAESHVSVRAVFAYEFYVFEAISIGIFSLEYLYRIIYAYKKSKVKTHLSQDFSFARQLMTTTYTVYDIYMYILAKKTILKKHLLKHSRLLYLDLDTDP